MFFLIDTDQNLAPLLSQIAKDVGNISIELQENDKEQGTRGSAGNEWYQLEVE